MWKIIILGLLSCVSASHFRGATIQWRPLNRNRFDGRIEITHRISWRRSSNGVACGASDIGTERLFGSGLLICEVGCRDSFPLNFLCTDFSEEEDWVSGSRSVVYNVGVRFAYFEASYVGGAWITLVTGGGGWEIRVKGSVWPRSDNGKINSSPVTAMTPIVRLRRGCTHTITIPYQDVDQDTVRCRWAEGNECSGVCNAFTGAILHQNNCSLTYTANGPTGWYAVAIQIEDFMSPTSTEPLSSVPLQFLVNVFRDNLPCEGNSEPTFITEETLPHDSCVAVPAGTTYNSAIVMHSGVPGASINLFVTTSPLGLTRSEIIQSQFNSSIYYVNVTWTPTESQLETIQIFCFRAGSSTGFETNLQCINFVAGVSEPTALQSSVSPTGTISPSTSTEWNITFNQPIRRPNGERFIRFYDEVTMELVYSLSTMSADVIFPLDGSNGRTLTFTPNFEFTPERSYYALMDSGIAVGTSFCLPSSAAVTNPRFWRFSIAMAAIPETTLPATTIPTTTVPATTVPATTVPVTTVPATVPAKTEPATTVPATTVPATTVPAMTVPTTTVPATTVPATTVPATTVPATTVPATTVQATTVPATTVIATTVPATTVPATTVPATTTTVPTTTVPATTVPATTVPATTVPATMVPATMVPATTVPATSVPTTTVPPTNVVPATTPGAVIATTMSTPTEESGIRVNDTVIGDPLYTVPVQVSQEQLNTLNLPKLSLCYEVHGTSNQWFNLISDNCVSVNAHYTSLNPSLNIMDGVAIRAVDTVSQCINIRVSLEQCAATVGSTAITTRGKYESNGITVKRYSNKVRISVPNCQDLTLVMWVICERRTLDMFGPPMTTDMIKFVVMRGLNSGSHQAHGLLGQFWNVPVGVAPYRGLLSDGTFQTGWYIVNITTGGTTRAYAGSLHRITWDQSREPCLYVGNTQAGPIAEVLDPNDPVIEGSFSGYVVKNPFYEDEDYKYGKFDETKCRTHFSF